jgi:hypothetical protein
MVLLKERPKIRGMGRRQIPDLRELGTVAASSGSAARERADRSPGNGIGNPLDRSRRGERPAERRSVDHPPAGRSAR